MKTLLLSIFAIILLASCGSDPVQPETVFTEKFMFDSVNTFIETQTGYIVHYVNDTDVQKKIKMMYAEQKLLDEYKEYSSAFFKFTFKKENGKTTMRYDYTTIYNINVTKVMDLLLSKDLNSTKRVVKFRPDFQINDESSVMLYIYSK